jgi:cell division protein FtsX
MFWVRLKRVIKAGWINFRRNSVVSYAAILVATITLTVVTALFLFQAILNASIASIQSKVDIAVYFTVNCKNYPKLPPCNTSRPISKSWPFAIVMPMTI